MTPARWQRARELFDSAIELPTAEADRYLSRECADDPELLSDLRRMLAEHQRSGVLDRSPWSSTAPSGAVPTECIQSDSIPPRHPTPTRRRLLIGGFSLAMLAAGWIGWNAWSAAKTRPIPEAARLYRQGVDDIQTGAYFAATQALERAVQSAPSSSPARARLAEAWLELDLPEKGTQEYLPVQREDSSSFPKIDKLETEAIYLTLTRDFSGAVNRYEQIVAQAGARAGERNLDLGRAYEKAGQPERAIAAYRRAAEGPAQSPAAWLRLAVLYNQRREEENSQTAFAEAERGYRQSGNGEGLSEVALQRGTAAARSRQYVEASVWLRKATEQAQGTGDIYQQISAKLTLAGVDYVTGDPALAGRLAREALDQAELNHIEPLTIRSLVTLGQAHMDKSDVAGAMAIFQQALALAQPTGSELLAALSHLAVASAYDRLRRPDDQISEARAALSYFEPNHYGQETFQSLLVLSRGELYRQNLAAAEESLQRLLDAATKAHDRQQMSQAFEALGTVAAAEENYPRALEYYREGLNTTSDPMLSDNAALHIATFLAKLGRYSGAEPELQRADAANLPQLRPAVARCRAEIALSRNQFREAIAIANASLAADCFDLTRIAGLALVRSGDHKAGLAKCDAALARARKDSDAGELLAGRLAVLEAKLAAHDAAGAAAAFRDLQPSFDTHPETAWRALALMSRADHQYVNLAREAARKLKLIWGSEAIADYITAPYLQELARPYFDSSN